MTWNLTERRRGLRRREDSGLLGLTAAVVHDLKDPLAGVGGLIGLVAQSLPPGSEERAALEAGQARLLRLDSLCDDLLLCARPITPGVSPVLVGDAIEAALSQLGPDPAFRPEPARAGLAVVGDPQLLVRLFRNLLQHAVAAGEETRIEIREVEGRCEIELPATPGLEEQAFEPLISDPGQLAAGLALPAARRIARAHGGEIRLHAPQPDRLTVSLPLLQRVK